MKHRVKRSSPLMRGAIVAMTHLNQIIPNSGAIGIDGVLPWHHSRDLKRFKRVTMGCAVIMGRVTWDSIGRKELPGRRNIVISRSAVPEVEHYNNMKAAFTACQEQDLWVIGGAQIYALAMPYLHLLDITYVPDVINDNNAVIFPTIERSWNIMKRRKLPLTNLINVVYQRVDSD